MAKDNCIYMIVTNDKYELPVFVGTAQEVADYQGVKVGSIYGAISHYEHGRNKTCIYRRVYGDMGTEY